MSDINEDDKPTVVLDLNSLKKQKLKQDEDLSGIITELEFNVAPEDEKKTAPEPSSSKVSLKIIFFDFQSNYFEKAKGALPVGHEYKIVKDLPGLNECLKQKSFQIVVFNYDANPKAVNQLCAQIKSKIPFTKTIITAKAISPDKALIHSKTPGGAHAYLKLPLENETLENEIMRIFSESKAAA